MKKNEIIGEVRRWSRACMPRMSNGILAAATTQQAPAHSVRAQMCIAMSVDGGRKPLLMMRQDAVSQDLVHRLKESTGVQRIYLVPGGGFGGERVCRIHA